MAAGTPGAHNDVDDLLQDVVERVLRKLMDEHAIDNVPAYVKKTARTAFIAWVTKRGREVLAPADRAGSLSTPFFEDRPDGSGRSLGSLRVSAERHVHNSKEIDRCLALLTPVERAVLVLRHGDEVSGARIAEQLGYKSAAVVDVTANRARRKLKECLPYSVLEALLGPQ